jgi:3-dehydrotetronate 4-kinase
MIGVPQGPWPEDADAVVVALKSRTTPVESAVRESLDALAWLRDAGCRQFYFKYCSTFDSTPRGNIGPVAEALMDALGADFTIACPAFPATRRTIYQGCLFVGDVPLNESGMQHHPLTPMTDANLVRVLQHQVTRRVGLVDYATVARGATAISERFAALRRDGFGFAVVDAVFDRDVEEIAAACAELPLVTGGSGVAQGLPQNFRRGGMQHESAVADVRAAGLRAVVAGSCSAATRQQVAIMRARHPAFRIDARELAGGRDVAGAALDWASTHVHGEPVLLYATAEPEEVRAVQADIGVEQAAALVEDALSKIAAGLVHLGVGQLIVAGGETAGAVLKTLGVTRLAIGPEIDPGVPWTAAILDTSTNPLALALKSGNFGSADFFLKAWSVLKLSS